MVLADPLRRALDLARQFGSRGVAVFDLDSTLLDNKPRQARILREFGAAEKVAALANMTPTHWSSWDLKDAMRNAGVAADVVERLAPQAKEFWRQKFFTSEYCALDDAIPGAVDFVRQVAESGVVVAYCTGRHEPMREGSIASFKRLGFPVPGVATHLLMKPQIETSDDDWKETAYDQLRRLGYVFAIFDNEPTHVNGYRNAFPDALVVHLDTDHSGRDVNVLPGILSVKDFSSPS